jgi:hypothetical protein
MSMNHRMMLMLMGGSAFSLAVALGAARYGAASRPTASTSAAMERSVHALESQLAELRQELARTQRTVLSEQRARLEQVESPRSATSSDAVGPTAPGDCQPDPAAQQHVPSTEETRDLLDARFSSEAEDRAWSREAEGQAQALLADHLLEPSRLLSLACKASLCRAEIGQPDEAAHRAYLEQTFTAPSKEWTGTLMASLVEQPTGNLSTVVFLARPGTELLSDADLAEPL